MKIFPSSIPNINHRPYFTQLVYFLFFFLACFSLTQFFTIAVMIPVVGWEQLENMDIGELNGFQIGVYKILQILSSIFLFVLPALLFSQAKTGDGLRYLKLHKQPDNLALLLLIGVMLTVLPFVGYVGYWNQGIVLPDFLSDVETWMRTAEEQMAQVLEVFLVMDSPLDLLFNLLMVAVFPAIGEELLFRGTLQSFLKEWTRKPHLAIWVTAFIFSFIHFQFYGFFPRFLLGVVLGYLFYWSGSLWYPIIGHFFNNGLQVVLVYAGVMKLDDTGAEMSDSLLMIAIATAVCGLLAYGFRSLFVAKKAL